MTPGKPFSEVSRRIESGGDAALASLGPGPFLIEIPTANPLGFEPPPTESSGTTAAMTLAFDQGLLLDLRRVRSSKESLLFALEPDAVVGRSRRCAIQLSGEGAVSKEHARFLKTDGTWRLEDLGTTNGTYVNLRRLGSGEQEQLPSLCSIQFGSRRFAFVAAESLQELLRPVSEVLPLRISQLRTELETLGSRLFTLRHHMPYLLVAYKGEEGSTSITSFKPSEAIPLVGDGPLRVGRTGQAEITLKRGSVSKWHAVLELRNHRWTVTDTGSSNGTVVNGVRLAKDASSKLASWDALAFGTTTWALFVEPRALLEWLVERDEG